MSSGFKKVWNTVTGVLVALVVIVAILLVGVRIVGLDVYMVLSGSMEPVYKTGSIVYVKEVDPYALKVGDDITYMLDEDTIATHRIIEVMPDPEDEEVVRFRTKGVNNKIADENPVHYKNVIGSPVFTIPYLGYVADYVQNPPGMYIAIAAGAVLILLCFLPDLLGGDDSEEIKVKGKKTAGPDPDPEEKPAEAEAPAEAAQPDEAEDK